MTHEQLRALKSPVITGLCDIGEDVDLRKLTKFADLILNINTISEYYLAVKKLLRRLLPTELLELLDDCNRLDIRVIRFTIYELFYVVGGDSFDVCDDLMVEYNKVRVFYDKLIADKYIKDKEVIAQSYINIYLACNTKMGVSYHFAKYLIGAGNCDLAVNLFTKCNVFRLSDKIHNEDLDQNQLQRPAIIGDHISRAWYVNGLLHNTSRLNGLLQHAMIDVNGNKEWYNNGKRHNDSRIDGLLQPAISRINGEKEWWINGKWHNDSRVNDLLQPAIIEADGSKMWYINGKCHNDSRVDGLLQPAIIYANGSKYWYINSVLHNDSRIDGLLQPAVILANGEKRWCVNGELHNDSRVGGLLQPAIIGANGDKEWWINGKRHNDDIVDGVLQPAIVLIDGTKEWYIDDIRQSIDNL